MAAPCEHERQVRRAAQELRVMRGQELLDLPKVQRILDEEHERCATND